MRSLRAVGYTFPEAHAKVQQRSRSNVNSIGNRREFPQLSKDTVPIENHWTLRSGLQNLYSQVVGSGENLVHTQKRYTIASASSKMKIYREIGTQTDESIYSQTETGGSQLHPELTV